MSDRIDQSEIGILNSDNNSTGNVSEGVNPSLRRRQQQHPSPQGPQIGRIFGPTPPRGFRMARRHLHPGNAAGIVPTIGTSNPNNNINGNSPHTIPFNGTLNGNRHPHPNAQQIRLMMGERGPFLVRQRQQRPSNVGEVDPTVDGAGPNSNMNSNTPQNVPSNGTVNGSSNANRNPNAPQIRTNMGGSGPVNTPRNNSLDGDSNGGSNANSTPNAQRVQIDVGGTGPFNTPQNIAPNGNANENSNASRNPNSQRVRINMGRRVRPFIVQQPSNRFARIGESQQRQQQIQFHPMGPNGQIPIQVRMPPVQVNPLTPQPLSASVQINTNTNTTNNRYRNSGNSNQRVEDPPVYERYKCGICYEYLNDPVGCGKCASRFCRTCLRKVYESDQQKQQPTKCPVCRCEYTEPVPDHEIYGPNGENAPTLPCRYACNGCPEHKLKLFEIAKHEQTCGHAPVRCRYAPFGCKWVGKRCLVSAHEEFGCKHAPMGTMIEQLRQMKADHGMRLEMVAQQASGAVRMSHVLRQTYMRDNQRKSLCDTLRLFQYCHAVTCLTPYFLMTKDLWVSYWRNNESRAAVVNFCICIPLLSAAFGVVGHGTASFFELFDEDSPSRTLLLLAKAVDGANTNTTNSTNHSVTTSITNMIQRVQQSETEELLITSFLGLCVGTLAALVIMLNFIDTKSNISWDKMSLPYLGGRFPLVGDVMAIAIFTLLLSIMEYHQSNMRSVALWTIIVASTTFFPAVVFALSHYTARLVTRTPRPVVFNLMELARLVEPCMFGLRFSMTITYFGVAATLDAMVVLSLVLPTSRMYLKNSMFDHMPRQACYAFLVAKPAFWAFKMYHHLFEGDVDLGILKTAVTVESVQDFFTSSSDAAALSTVLDNISTSVLATASLLVTNCVINNFFALGMTVGDCIALESQGELTPEGIARGTAKEYSSAGLVVFGSWVMMIALLARI